MGKRLLVGAAVAAILLFGIAYLVSPVLAARSLASAARSGDADQLQQFVDFPAVRESLKSQINARLVASIRGNSEGATNPFANLAMTVAPAIVGQVIDGYVTPDGIAAMIAGNVPMQKQAPDPGTGGAGSGSATREPEYAYKNLDTFVLTSSNDGDRKTSFGFYLHRQGLFTWRLTRIQLPEHLLGEVP